MKKVLVLLFCGVLMCSVIGCAEDEVAAGLPPVADIAEPAATISDAPDAVKTQETQDEVVDEMESPEESISEFVNEEIRLETVDEQGTAETSTESLSGIIMVQQYRESLDSQGATFVYEIVCIDPDTGSTKQVASFHVWTPANQYSVDSYFTLPQIGLQNKLGGDRRYFSSDFTKMAITKHFNVKDESHAGWIDQAGNYFDVTEALNEQSSDFGDPVHYSPAGFTEDGYFVYNDVDDQWWIDWQHGNFYYVAVDSLTTSQPGNLLENELMLDSGGYYITDWLDDTRCIVDSLRETFHTDSLIYDLATDEPISYIPGSSRLNWSGVVNPDKDSIAFLSTPVETPNRQETLHVYIASINGDEEPKIVNCDMLLGNDPIIMWALTEWR